jgi:hypothetical protein
METTIPHLRTTTTHMKPATKLSLLKESWERKKGSTTKLSKTKTTTTTHMQLFE